MRMTPAVRISLLALRGYLVLMMLLLLYHVLGWPACSARCRQNKAGKRGHDPQEERELELDQLQNLGWPPPF